MRDQKFIKEKFSKFMYDINLDINFSFQYKNTENRARNFDFMKKIARRNNAAIVRKVTNIILRLENTMDISAHFNLTSKRKKAESVERARCLFAEALLAASL